MIVAVPAVEAVNVLVHVAVPTVVPAANVHVVNVPVTPDRVKLTDPVGVLTVPAAVSVTVAVQLVAWLTKTGEGVHATVVVVGLLLTVTFALPLLAR